MEGPDGIGGGIGHHIGPGGHVTHGLHLNVLLGPVACVALGELTHPDPVPWWESPAPEAQHGSRASWRAQPFPDALHISPIHLLQWHADGAVMDGVKGMQQG